MPPPKGMMLAGVPEGSKAVHVAERLLPAEGPGSASLGAAV